jgi:hypothetical protein
VGGGDDHEYPRRLGQHWLGLKARQGATPLAGNSKNAQQALKF